MTPQTVVETIDHASMMSDRWMFLAALAIILLGGAVVIKWLVASLAEKDKSHQEERTAYHQEIKQERLEARQQRREDQLEFLAGLTELRTELEKLAKLLDENTKILTKHDQDMREAHKIETSSLIHSELLRLGINPSATKVG